MSSPKEPGHSAGAVSESADVPPWQRGMAARASRGGDARPATVDTASVEARVNRFTTGSSAPARTTAESDGVRAEAYRSELPDLSGPRPPATRKPERAAVESPSRSATATARTAAVDTRSRASGPVRASVQLRRVDPWSVLKVSLILSVALFFVWMIAVAFLYLVLGGMGVWSKLNSNVGDLLTQTTDAQLVSSGSIFGGAALVGLVNIVLLSAMATVGAFIYNLTTDLVGGVEVTLADRD